MILPASYQNGFAPRDGQPLYPSLWKGCVGAWNPGLGPTGSVLYDNSANKNNVNFSSGLSSTVWQKQSGSSVIDYVGTTSQTFNTNRLINNAAVTVSLWISRNGSGGGLYAMPIGLTSTGQDGWRFWQSSTEGQYYWSINSYNTVGHLITLPILTDRKFTHWVGMFDGTKSSAYVDGLFIEEKTPGVSLSWTGATGAIYNRSGWSAFSGSLTDVQIYNRALSPDEIRTLATRRGIAYEMAPRRRSSVQVTTNRLRRALIGS
jgi:hypothetical protein